MQATCDTTGHTVDRGSRAEWIIFQTWQETHRIESLLKVEECVPCEGEVVNWIVVLALWEIFGVVDLVL